MNRNFQFIQQIVHRFVDMRKAPTFVSIWRSVASNHKY
jgi:hypothetical protein